MAEKKSRRVYAGYYNRYDGKLIYVVRVVTDIDTGKEIVICQYANYSDTGEYYTIPYRCLIPQKAENLLVAGRCISSDHGAQASYRIMPTVCTLGEAAGTAVALAVKEKTDVREVDMPLLQRTLTKRNAFLGI